MVLTSLLAGAMMAVFSPQQHPSVYRQVVKQPNINNGYEDYLRGVDLIADRTVDDLLYWTPDLYEGIVEEKKSVLAGPSDPENRWSAEREARLIYFRELDSSNRLAINRLLVEKFGNALNYLRSGNQKRVWDPRDTLNAETVFPELGRFRRLAQL